MFLLQWLWIFCVRAVLIVLGLVVVPVALPFSDWTSSASDGRPITTLPRWAWLWANDFDGNLGDKRGWWDRNAPFGLGAHSLISQFWWLAIRNPVNNLRRTAFGSCPVSECVVAWKGNNRYVEDRPGGGGWQFVTATHVESGRRWYGFYGVHEWGGGRAAVVRLGFKILASHADRPGEAPKGFTVKFNPWKKI